MLVLTNNATRGVDTWLEKCANFGYQGKYFRLNFICFYGISGRYFVAHCSTPEIPKSQSGIGSVALVGMEMETGD